MYIIILHSMYYINNVHVYKHLATKKVLNQYQISVLELRTRYGC